MLKVLTCIECPIGCEVKVQMDENDTILSVTGNACPRGKMYAQNDVVCPKRVITSTVKAEDGTLVPVKTDKPVRKSQTFEVMKKINEVTCKLPVKIGDVLVENICDDAHLIATGNAE